MGFLNTFVFIALVYGASSLKDTVEEGECIMPALANLTQQSFLDATPAGGFYIPFKTKFEAFQVAELFLNKTLTAEDDLSQFCPRLIWQPKIGESEGTWFGFGGKNASMKCNSHDTIFEYQNCTIIYNTSGDKVSKIDDMDYCNISVSQKQLEHLNVGKRRRINTLNWADNAAKFRRNAGLPYVGRNGIENEGCIPPSQEYHCEQRCQNLGCVIPHERRLVIFQEFWGLGNWNLQSTTLMHFMEKQQVARRTTDELLSRRNATYTYFITDENYNKVRVCRKTFMATFGVTEARVRSVQRKMNDGNLAALDFRGQHLNRPHRSLPDVRANIISHILSFPRQISHYARNAGDPLREYLECDLSVAKMFRLYCEVAGEIVFSQQKVYYDTFKELNLRFRAPRSDTCDKCDELFIAISNLDESNPENENILNELWLTSVEHHLKAEDGFQRLSEDYRQSQVNPNYKVVSIDMQAVISIPKLTNSEQYYKRKYACYNIAIHRADTESTTMCVWHKRDGNRGASEVFSCMYQFCLRNFNILEDGQERTLVVWSDRCCGQNNNFETVCGYRYLVALNYFTEIQQKFMCTGHSFLPCDRQFALVERRMKTASLLTIDDCVKMFETASLANPFRVQRMDRETILDFDALVREVRRPASLKVTHAMTIKVEARNPNSIFVKEDHTYTEWEEHHSPTRQIANLVAMNPPPKYQEALPLDAALVRDLSSMQKYLPAASRAFWQFLN